MIVIRKKKILNELATCLYLVMEYNTDTTAYSVVSRIRERAKDALQDAAQYTGKISEKDVRQFLESKMLTFSIACEADIIKGDTIRFVETVYSHEVTPPRRLGKRGIVAEVLDRSSREILTLHVLSSGGKHQLEPDTFIRRTLRAVTHMEVMRTAWDSEAKREKVKAEAQICERQD